jgi:uncharacterized metal-binding protein YceD (DUF177 family)
MTQPDSDLTLFEDPLDPDELDLETPIADAAGVAAPIAPTSIPALLRPPFSSVPFEADEYDALEQSQVVPNPEDDYR